MSFISQFDDARFHNRDAVCLSISSPLNLNAFFDSPHHRCGGRLLVCEVASRSFMVLLPSGVARRKNDA
jgi:hypothetical protein